jgi:hypothetical protein
VIKRQYFGWLDAEKHTFRVSLYPPDAPVRPSVEIETKDEVMALIERKRASIYWWPPLPDAMNVRASF